MNEIQANRLLGVATALRDADAANWAFEMSTYGWDGDLSRNHRLDLGIPKSECKFVTDHKCGTPACAIGHYAVRRDLQRSFALDKGGDLVDNNGYSVMHDSYQSLKHFGIDYDEAEELFDSDGCGNASTALAAAKYIENFIERKGFYIS